jgi:predicted  nucleic acid-binding Zn-ribbon protein
MLWICNNCTTAYPPEHPTGCPHCGDHHHHEQGNEPMPKATVHGGATNVDLATDPTSPTETPETPAEGVTEAPKADTPEEAVQDAQDDVEADPDTEPEAPARPATSATVATWAAYVVALGGNADGLTKAELIALATELEG